MCYCLRIYNFTTKKATKIDWIADDLEREELLYALYMLDGEYFNDNNFARINDYDIDSSNLSLTSFPNGYEEWRGDKHINQRMWTLRIYKKENNHLLPLSVDEEAELIKESRDYTETKDYTYNIKEWLSEGHFRNPQYKKYKTYDTEVFDEYPKLKKYQKRDNVHYRNSDPWNGCEKPTNDKTVRDKDRVRKAWSKKVHQYVLKAMKKKEVEEDESA